MPLSEIVVIRNLGTFNSMVLGTFNSDLCVLQLLVLDVDAHLRVQPEDGVKGHGGGINFPLGHNLEITFATHPNTYEPKLPAFQRGPLNVSSLF